MRSTAFRSAAWLRAAGALFCALPAALALPVALAASSSLLPVERLSAAGWFAAAVAGQSSSWICTLTGRPSTSASVVPK